MNLYEKDNDCILNRYSSCPRGISYSEASIYKNIQASVDLSIIVPCYNAEKYLCECLDSLVGQQTDCKYEIITVNDGSQDRTDDILAEYAKEYSFIKVITQENRGFSGARNAGVVEACGKYIAFVDSDDYVSENYIDGLMKIALKHKADIVACGYFTFRDKVKYKSVMPNGLRDEKILGGCFWAKVFKRELLEHIVQPEGYWYEDSVVSHLIKPLVNDFYTVNTCQYAYRSNPKGITITSKKKNKALDTFYITDLMLRSIDKVISSEYKRSLVYYEVLIVQLYINAERLLGLSQELQKEVFRLQSKYLNAEFPVGAGYSSQNARCRRYEKALREGNYKKAYRAVSMKKVYRIMDVLVNKMKK